MSLTSVTDVIDPPDDAHLDVAVEVSARRRNLILGAMSFAVVLVVASVSMLNVALPTLSRALGASPTEQLWIVDAYTVALAALLLPFGAIGDRFGRRTTLLLGIATFGIASALAAGVDTSGTLIALRVVTGIGAALIMPGTLSTITSVFPPSERARAVGVWAGFAGAGGMLGMLASGWMLEHFWWGSIFVLSAVLATAAFVVSVAVVPNTRDPEHAHLDPFGSLLSVVAIGGLVLGIIEGPHRGWTDAITVTGLGLGLAAAAGWIVWSLRTSTPLLDPRLFRLRGFRTGSLSLFLLFFAMFGFFLVALQFLQLILGYGTLKASVALLPTVLVMLPLSTVAARLSERWGQKIVGTVGLAVAGSGFVVLSTLTTASGYSSFVPALVLIGAGLALAMTPATNAIVGSLPAAKQGVASAVNDTAREVGAAFGIAVLGSMFNSGYRSNLGDITSTLPADAAAAVREGPAYALAVAGKLGDAGPAVADAARSAFISGMQWATLLGAAALAIGALITWAQAPGAPSVEAVDDLDGDLEDGGPVLIPAVVETTGR